MSEEKYEGIRHTEKLGKPTYIMVPKKLVIALSVAFMGMLIMTLVSTQAAYFVDRRSNQRWCGIVLLFNDTYKDAPPTSDTGRKFAIEFIKLQREFKCK